MLRLELLPPLPVHTVTFTKSAFSANVDTYHVGSSFGTAGTTLCTSAVASADGEALRGGIERLAGKWDNRVCSRVVIIGVWCNSAEGKA